MKKVTSILFLLLFWSSGLVAQDYYYSYEGERMPLYLNTEYAYLLLDGVDSAEELTALIPDIEVIEFGTSNAARTLKAVPGTSFKKDGQSWAEIAINSPDRSPESYLAYLGGLEEREFVKLASPYFSDEDDGKIGISEYFVVRLNSPADLSTLIAMAENTGTQIVGQNRFMANWYTLSCNEDAKGNALEMANLFAESGKFSTAQPDMLIGDELTCVDDTWWGNQWGMDHTGQNGWTPQEDINACDGWANWTTGNRDIVVAILDDGYETDHPDLAANNVGDGWDTESGSAPSQVLDFHANPCAGIVAAVGNNNEGISGVCPDCGLVSVSNSFAATPNARIARADGINWAWQNGAAVISNSWGSGVRYSVIDDAIDSALYHGRNGLGTIVVFAAGNDDGIVAYPANSNPDIIVVGAMSPCAERKSPTSCDGETRWGSNYGGQLDVVAPGVNVPAPDRQGIFGLGPGNYIQDFNGTSSACPHVAGLAGLLLSLNPCLTQLEVATIIESTAQKVGTYLYIPYVGRPRGTWNNEMGYGLIDVNAALARANELRLQNRLVFQYASYFANRIFVGNNVNPNQTPGDFVIFQNTAVFMRAFEFVEFAPGFEIRHGGNLTVNFPVCDANKQSPNQETGLLVDDRSAKEPVTGPEPVSDSFEVYPNPFSEGLNLSFQVEGKGARVSASLYDLQGRQVAQLIAPGFREAGPYREVVLPEANLPPGLYLVRLVMDGHAKVKKLIKE